VWLSEGARLACGCHAAGKAEARRRGCRSGGTVLRASCGACSPPAPLCLASRRPFGAAPAGPAGWSWKVRGGLQVRTEGCVKIIGVPYSEHSSFPELRWVTGKVQRRAG
jgi:hypothetical protein